MIMIEYVFWLLVFVQLQYLPFLCIFMIVEMMRTKKGIFRAKERNFEYRTDTEIRILNFENLFKKCVLGEFEIVRN